MLQQIAVVGHKSFPIFWDDSYWLGAIATVIFLGGMASVFLMNFRNVLLHRGEGDNKGEHDICFGIVPGLLFFPFFVFLDPYDSFVNRFVLGVVFGPMMYFVVGLFFAIAGAIAGGIVKEFASIMNERLAYGIIIVVAGASLAAALKYTLLASWLLTFPLWAILTMALMIFVVVTFMTFGEGSGGLGSYGEDPYHHT